MITRYALIAALAGALVLGGLLYRERALRATSEAHVARLTRSVAALTQQAEQARLARQVEAARAERWRERNAELADTIEQLREIPDAPLDPRIIELLDGLRSAD